MVDNIDLWVKGAAALKGAFDTARAAIGLVSDANKLSGGSPQQKKAVETALATASSSTAIAEVEVAKALGYQFCKCEFPPTMMLTVGYSVGTYDKSLNAGDAVYECPKCGFNNSGGWGYTQLKPPHPSTTSSS